MARGLASAPPGHRGDLGALGRGTGDRLRTAGEMLAGAWNKVPEPSIGVVKRGQDELYVFTPRRPGGDASSPKKRGGPPRVEQGRQASRKPAWGFQ